MACRADVRTYDLVAHKWKYVIAAGWSLQTVFNVWWETYQQICPLGVKLLNVDVGKMLFIQGNISFARIPVHKISGHSSRVLFFRGIPTNILHVCGFLHQIF